MSATRLRRYLRHGMLPQLAVFEASVRLGTFTRAADELHVAQPTVSTQIRKLTEAVGHPLFEQVGRKMHMTAAGTALYAACQDILRTLSRLDEHFAELDGVQRGRLRLAVGSPAECLAMRLLGTFVERYPDVEVVLEVRNHAGLVERLVANEDDLYLFANPPTEREVIRQSILPNPLVPIARFDHPLAARRSIPFARFAQERFLLREHGSATREIASELFAKHGVKPRIRMELSTHDAVVRAVSAGLGVSIVSRHGYALNGASPIVALDVEGLPVDRPWHFVYPVGKQLCPVARGFMDHVRAQAPALLGPAGAAACLLRPSDGGSAASCSRRTDTARAR